MTNLVAAIIVKDRITVGHQTGNSFLVKESGWLLKPVSTATLLVCYGIFKEFYVYQVKFYTLLRKDGVTVTANRKIFLLIDVTITTPKITSITLNNISTSCCFFLHLGAHMLICKRSQEIKHRFTDTHENGTENKTHLHCLWYAT